MSSEIKNFINKFFNSLLYSMLADITSLQDFIS